MIMAEKKLKQTRVDEQASSEVGAVRVPRSKRRCFFCEGQKEPSFADSVTLRRFISDRSRIVPRIRTGICSKHHRRLTRQIKYSRHLALLPFITRA